MSAPLRLIMCQHCMNSDTNIISHHAFLKYSASLQKRKNKDIFQARHILSGQNVMAFKVMYYFSLQSNSSLLNLVLSSMKWSLPYLWLQLHGAIYRPDSFVLMLRYCVNLEAIRYESTSLNRIVADKSHRTIIALQDPKQDVKIKEALYIRILTFSSSSIYGEMIV